MGEDVVMESMVVAGPSPSDRSDEADHDVAGCFASEEGSADQVATDKTVIEDATPDYRAQIEAIYKEYNPDQMSNIDELMRKHAGREMELIHMLHDKYVKGHKKLATAKPAMTKRFAWRR